VRSEQIVHIADEATAIEREFLAALIRLVENRPLHARLAELALRGPIRPSQTNVALEAGHSRTLISGKACELPRVQLEIKRAQASHRDGKRPGAILDVLDGFGIETALRRECARLKEERDEVRRQRDAAYTSAAASRMLAVAIQQSTRIADADVTELRRAAEQTVLSSKAISAS
jgi:hypothetical protein